MILPAPSTLPARLPLLPPIQLTSSTYSRAHGMYYYILPPPMPHQPFKVHTTENQMHPHNKNIKSNKQNRNPIIKNSINKNSINKSISSKIITIDMVKKSCAYGCPWP